MDANPIKRLCACLWLTLMVAPAIAIAQDPAPAESDAEADDPSRETDISEDNYRRFMELDDRRLERPAFPVASVAPTTTLQKMGQLPESSQKHLRNQLRGIILSRGAWTPAERDEAYPFVPSAEARGDAQLLRQEAEAWAELVNEYHDREAAILAGAAGQPSGEDGPEPQGQAAMGQPPGSQASQQVNAGAGSGSSAAGEGQQGEDGDPGQEGREGAQGESGSEGGPDGKSGTNSNSASPPPERPEIPEWASEDDAGPSPTPPGDEGVEQSASAYLEARGMANSSSFDFQGAQDLRAPATEERASRWGEEAQTLLDDPDTTEHSAQFRGSFPAADDRSQGEAPANSLTREQLRQVRGVSEEPLPQDAFFGEIDRGRSGSSAGEAGSEEVPDEEEATGEDPDRTGGGQR